MKKVVFAIVFICNTAIYSQTFDGDLGSKSLKWNTEQKDFNSAPRIGVDAMSIKLWDNYNGANAPSDFGSLLEISGKYGHLISQLYFDSTWNGARIFYRSAFYDQNNWESWRYLLDSKNDVVSSGNLKIAGNGDSYISGNLGIGTSSPASKLEIAGSSQIGYEVGTLKLRSSSADQFMYFGYDDQFSAGYIQSVKPGTDQQNILIAPVGGNVGIGTTNPDSKLTVAGNIHAQEVKVTVNAGVVPDYVFANDYKLKSLQEVEEYIKENSHLPEIPSAQEIGKNGLMLAEMNMNLLKKIEEMTLYMIEMKKEIQKQNDRILTLEKK